MDELFDGMDCSRLRKSMKDSIMMTSLLSAMNKAHEKLQSKQGIIGRLIEISKFYELAVMQLEGCLKMVEEETDADNWCLELGHEEVLSDLHMIRSRLKQRLQDTDNTISDMDKALTGRLENELNLRQILETKEKELTSLRDELDEFQKETVPGELKSCIDKQLPQFEELVENNTQDEQLKTMQNAILYSGTEPAEQELRWSLEKEIIFSTTEGFLKDMQEEFQTRLRGSERNIIAVLSQHWSNSMNKIRSLRSELDTFTHERQFSPRARKFVSLEGNNYGQVDQDHNFVRDEQTSHAEKVAVGDESHCVAKMIKSHETLIRQNSDELKWIKGELVTEKGFRRDKDYGSPKTNKLHEVIFRLDNFIHLNTCVVEDTLSRNRADSSLEKNYDEDMVGEKMMKVKTEIQDSDFLSKMLEETYVVLLRGLRNEFYSQIIHDGNVKEGTDEKSAEDCTTEKHCNSENIIKEQIHRIVLEETMKSILHNYAFASSSRYQDVSREALPSLEEIGKVHRLEIEDIKICNHIQEDIYQFIVVEAAKDACAISMGSLNSPAVDKSGTCQDSREDTFMQKLFSALESFGSEENSSRECTTMGSEHEYLDQNAIPVEDESVFTSLSSKFEQTLHQLHESKMILCELGNAGAAEVELDMKVDQMAPCKDHLPEEEGEKHFVPRNKEPDHDNKLRLSELILMEFDRALERFKQTIGDRIATNMLRVEEAKNQLKPLRKLSETLQKKETTYRKAFIRRCEDLHKAEAEVDLLGDQVDVLLGLLETIHMTLLQHSSVFEKHQQVLDVVNLIRKQVPTGGAITGKFDKASHLT